MIQEQFLEWVESTLQKQNISAAKHLTTVYCVLDKNYLLHHIPDTNSVALQIDYDLFDEHLTVLGENDLLKDKVKDLIIRYTDIEIINNLSLYTAHKPNPQLV